MLPTSHWSALKHVLVKFVCAHLLFHLVRKLCEHAPLIMTHDLASPIRAVHSESVFAF
jgi:hypothetical protein